MQISQERGHLRVIEPAFKCGHHSLPIKHNLADLRVGGRCATREFELVEDAVEIGRYLLQRKIVVLVTMRASPLVKMLPCRLLRRELRNAMATRQAKSPACEDHEPDRAAKCTGSPRPKMKAHIYDSKREGLFGILKP